MSLGHVKHRGKLSKFGIPVYSDKQRTRTRSDAASLQLIACKLFGQNGGCLERTVMNNGVLIYPEGIGLVWEFPLEQRKQHCRTVEEILPVP